MTDSTNTENALQEALRASAKVYQQRERAAMSMSVSDSSALAADKASHHSDGAYVEKWEERKKRRAAEAAAAKAALHPKPQHVARNVTTTLISRDAAMAKGLTRYFTGERCSHGHLAERIVSTRTCVECHRLHQLKNKTNVGREARRKAKAEGKDRYFSPQRCSRGHVSERTVSTGRCIACQNDDTAKSRQRISRN